MAARGAEPVVLQGRFTVLPLFLETLRDKGPSHALALPRAQQAERCGQYIANCMQTERQEWLERLLDLPSPALRSNILNRVQTHRDLNRLIVENRIRLKRPLSCDTHGTIHP